MTALDDLRALFAGGPDTAIRTTWHDGLEYWEAPADELRSILSALLDAPTPTTAGDDQREALDTRGLHDKFHIERTDGRSAYGQKHHGCRYFVLDLDHDEDASTAVAAYADAVRNTRPELAADLDRAWPAARRSAPTEAHAFTLDCPGCAGTGGHIARPSAPTVRPDDLRCPTCDGFVARPLAAPTVTTEQRALAALTTLVALKDGARDETYYAERDAAWQNAREVIASVPLGIEVTP